VRKENRERNGGRKTEDRGKNSKQVTHKEDE
jgi:hypothetical protein